MSTIQQTLIISQAEEYVFSNTPETFITKFLTYCFKENDIWQINVTMEEEEQAPVEAAEAVSAMEDAEAPAAEAAGAVAEAGPIRATGREGRRSRPYSRPIPTPNLGGNLTKKHKSKLHCKTKHKYVKLNKHKNTKKQNIKIKKYTRKH